MGYGWAYAMPVRGVQPGTPVRFWNRLVNTEGGVMIDYGDGAPEVVIRDETVHTYSAPGLYTVTVRGCDSRGAVVMTKLPVRVELSESASQNADARR
jgi:hypothetical protein